MYLQMLNCKFVDHLLLVIIQPELWLSLKGSLCSLTVMLVVFLHLESHGVEKIMPSYQLVDQFIGRFVTSCTLDIYMNSVLTS